MAQERKHILEIGLKDGNVLTLEPSSGQAELAVKQFKEGKMVCVEVIGSMVPTAVCNSEIRYIRDSYV